MTRYLSPFFDFVLGLQTKKPIVKAAWVAAGYAFALAVAMVAVMCSLMLSGGNSNPIYSGMHAFGDALLFLAVFGIASIPATYLTFTFLKPWHALWRGFPNLALLCSITAFAASLTLIFAPMSLPGSLSFLRVLIAPLFALPFGLSALNAPDQKSRTTLFTAGGLELASLACWIIACLIRNA